MSSGSATNPGRGLRLLSLDGGGIKGLSELLILQDIMLKLQEELGLTEVPRPAQFFDLIGGTSTGGLVELMMLCSQILITHDH
jgi:patatin-like phospholipase/acyl hydrolase